MSWMPNSSILFLHIGLSGHMWSRMSSKAATRGSRFLGGSVSGASIALAAKYDTGRKTARHGTDTCRVLGRKVCTCFLIRFDASWVTFIQWVSLRFLQLVIARIDSVRSKPENTKEKLAVFFLVGWENRLIWSDLVWSGLIWSDLVWSDLVWIYRFWMFIFPFSFTPARLV